MPEQRGRGVFRGGCLPKRLGLHFNQQKRCQKKDVGKHLWGGEMNQQKLNQHESTLADSTFSVTFFTQSHRLGESSGWDHGGPCHLMVLREASCEGLILGAEVLGTQSMKSRHRLRWWSYHSINQWTMAGHVSQKNDCAAYVYTVSKRSVILILVSGIKPTVQSSHRKELVLDEFLHVWWQWGIE